MQMEPAMQTSQTQTFTITEVKPSGNVQRTVTLAEYRAIIDERKAAAAPIMAAMRAGDLVAVAKAQASFRARFA